MEYRIKAGPQGHFYIPKIIREALGDELKLVPNAKAGVIFPEGADLKEVILSLQVIIQDLKIRASLHKDSEKIGKRENTLEAAVQ